MAVRSMKIQTCLLSLCCVITIVNGDFCDCNLTLHEQPLLYDTLPQRLESQEKLLDSLEKRYERLINENKLNLERLGSAKSTIEGLTETAYKIANKCPEKTLRCITGGQCINELLGCDGVVDCPDGSDEDPYTCVMPITPRVRLQCTLPASQTCFPEGGAVHLAAAVLKVKWLKWLPQIGQMESMMTYSFNKTNDGSHVYGELDGSSIYFTARGKLQSFYKNDKYTIKAQGTTSYFLESVRSYAQFYSGKSLKTECGACYYKAYYV